MRTVKREVEGFRAPSVVVLDFSPANSPRRWSHAPGFGVHNAQARRWGIWCGALVGTALVHSLLVGSLMFGTGKHQSRAPSNEGFHAAGSASDGVELVSVLIFVNDKSIRDTDSGNESVYAVSQEMKEVEGFTARLATADNTISVQPPSLEDVSEGTVEIEETAGDGAEAAMLFGRYMGQIKARIERAWSYPVSPSRSTFYCKVQIRQSRNGDVGEVTLQHCDLDPEWQVSLARAIQAASPLSAPPNENVFTEVVTLDFSARLQTAGADYSLTANARM